MLIWQLQPAWTWSNTATECIHIQLLMSEPESEEKTEPETSTNSCVDHAYGSQTGPLTWWYSHHAADMSTNPLPTPCESVSLVSYSGGKKVSKYVKRLRSVYVGGARNSYITLVFYVTFSAFSLQ